MDFETFDTDGNNHIENKYKFDPMDFETSCLNDSNTSIYNV